MVVFIVMFIGEDILVWVILLGDLLVLLFEGYVYMLINWDVLMWLVCVEYGVLILFGGVCYYMFVFFD